MILTLDSLAAEVYISVCCCSIAYVTLHQAHSTKHRLQRKCVPSAPSAEACFWCYGRCDSRARVPKADFEMLRGYSLAAVDADHALYWTRCYQKPPL